MKITPRILSIPPYLSTTWENIASLHMKPVGNLFTLIVVLNSQAQVEIPGLNKGTIDEIFEAHAGSAEADPQEKTPLEGPFSFSLPMKNREKEGGLADFDFKTSMEHDPSQKDIPDIPKDVLTKITTIAKAFGIEDLSAFSNPQPNCNCIYCQVARALYGNSKREIEDEVSDEDLKFRSNWDVKQTEDKLYRVANTLDQNESYNVFLGTPLGCTCGSKNCEHIRAVLQS